MRLRGLFTFMALPVLVLAACRHGAAAPDEPPDRSNYRFVMGLITDPDGAGVPGAHVRFSGIYVGGGGSPQAEIGGCSGIRLLVDSSIVTDASGRFSTLLQIGPVNPLLCLGFEVTPATASKLAPAIVTIRNVSILGSRASMDTTYLAVHLQRAP